MNELKKARITQVNRGSYIARLDGKDMTARLSGKLQHRQNYPVIGDYVMVQPVNENEAVIEEILERTSYLCRPDNSGHADGYVKTYTEQAMTANLDYLFIITSLNDDFSINRIARFAATSIKGGCKPVVILTKADLCPDKERFLAEVRTLNASMEVFCVSAHTGEGMEEIRAFLKPGITIGLIGSSGVGKSTLINTLAGRSVMKVNDIRDKDSKGRHTTTHREMIDIDGVFVIDTPGMRGFGICDVQEGIDETFDDIAELVTQCRFSNCSHGAEPGCAVKAAIREGRLSVARWELYFSLLAESNRTRSRSLRKQIAIQKKKMGI